MMDKKSYFFRISYGNRMGKRIGTTVGVVWAESEKNAIDVVWNKYGNNYAYKPEVCEVGADGYAYYIPS